MPYLEALTTYYQEVVTVAAERERWPEFRSVLIETAGAFHARGLSPVEGAMALFVAMARVMEEDGEISGTEVRNYTRLAVRWAIGHGVAPAAIDRIVGPGLDVWDTPPSLRQVPSSYTARQPH